MIDDREYIAPLPGNRTGVVADADGAARALGRLVTGVRRGDAPTGDDPTAVALRNAAALRVTHVAARYVSEDGPVAADGSWTADVELSWRFAGFDARTISEEVPVGFRSSGTGVVITGFGGAAGRVPIWLSGAVTVRRSADTLVLVQGGATKADEYARLAKNAVAAVRRVVPWRSPRLVLEVPARQGGLENAMGAEPDSYRGVAAVTATVDGSSSATAPVHIFVNPDVIGNLKGVGAQVVLSHEATHAATGAATNTVRPTWLNEGFADYVALRDVDLPLATTAGQILKEVRRHGAPTHLPDKSDFNSQADTFGMEYEEAWLACRTLAQVGGEKALVRLYDQTGDGTPLEAALRKDFGFGTREFTKIWRQRLSDLAS